MLILVNPPSLYEVPAHLRGRYAYLELVMKHIGDARALRSFPAEHLGLMSIKASAEAQGLAAAVVNAITALHRSEEQTFSAIEDVVRRSGPPTLIGFSGTNLVYAENLALAIRCRARWPEVRILFGHDFATLNATRLLREQPVIDYVCEGEGERLVPELARCLGAGEPVHGIPGLVWRDGDGVHANPPEPLDLDQLPLASRQDLAPTLALGLAPAVWTTRGCPYRCTFCTTGEVAGRLGAGPSYRARAIEPVVDEIARLARDHGVAHVTITDDLFVTRQPESQARAERFAEEMLRRAPGVTFMLDCRVDSVRRDLFGLLARAGLRKVFVGVESGSEAQRLAYRKSYGRQGRDPVEPLRVLLDLGIELVPGILTWHPEIRPEELRASLRVADAAGSRGMYQLINRVKPYPGTPLHTQYRDRGWLSVDWPVATWDFRDPRARRLAEEVTAAANREGSSFDEVRGVFLAGIEAWEAELSPDRPDPGP